MASSTRHFSRNSLKDAWPRRDLTREWLVTNGLGGYASGTVDGVFSRRYHGLLIAALPMGRTMMLNGVSERVRLADRSVVYLGVEELSGASPDVTVPVSEFHLEMGLPVWVWDTPEFEIEKRLFMPYRQNTVYVTYRIRRANGPLRMGIRPSVHFRSHDAPVNTPLPEPFRVSFEEDHCTISANGFEPVLRLRIAAPAAAFTYDRKLVPEIIYPVEESRGYEYSGNSWSPGYFRADLNAGETACLAASTEAWDAILALDASAALDTEQRRRQGLLAAAPGTEESPFSRDLVLAGDQFLITPASRASDAAVARAEGEEAWTVIAGYHWFTDWGRDTMISLEGLTISTGRLKEARWILRTFAHYVRDGLIPNFFPDGQKEGVYHTADATLWFFHALHRYLRASGDRETLRVILPKLLEIVECHVRGTRFGIGVDSKDGLLRQGEEGYQLTWMDAKVDDWVVTPRRGKAVEINALWYNALCILAGWLEDEGRPGVAGLRARAAEVRRSFNERFWREDLGYLYDVVDGENGDDDSLRPNQLFSFSLEHPVLDEKYWPRVLREVERKLLTPVGLRSLAPGSPEYKSAYFGDLRARDAAYHQGTVWGWLIGPYIDAWLRVNPSDAEGALRLLQGFEAHLDQACVGSISEIFDGDPPYHPRGCVAQAWSVAEVLRCWTRLTQMRKEPEVAASSPTRANGMQP